MSRSPKLVALACATTLFSWLGLGCSDQALTTSEAKVGMLVVSQVLFRSASDSLEWLEIRNDGDGDAMLAGVKIAAIDYKFPSTTAPLAPGKRLVLTNDPSLFALRHPGVAMGGVYSGRLSNEGEDIQLDGAEGKDFQFAYKPREPWPAGPGVVGTSLVYLGGDPNSPSSWASSAKQGGSPGEAAPTTTDKGIWISEVRPADADGNGFVELASEAADEIDLSGWIVAASFGSTKSDTLPAGTRLPAHGRLVLRQTPGPQETGWGALLPSSVSDELVLIESASAGVVTGNVHTIAWSGAVPEGLSVGRIGDIGFYAGTGLIDPPTPGLANAARRKGLVSITEVCFHPDSADAEFVEIQNETDSVIHLGYPADTARSWSLSGTGKTFLSTDTLAPRGRMVLVAKDDMAVDGFRSKWKIPASVPVVAFPGKLDNDGETLELRHPSIPTAGKNGLVWKYLVEDDATWSEHAPWPSVGGGGDSCLQRISTTLPGTSPAAWTASMPTPGK